jgi:predicted RNase H-like HicB family nuclease
LRGEKMATRTFTAVLHKEEDMYVAECPEVGTVSQGRAIKEAVANLKEATEVYLEEIASTGVVNFRLIKFDHRSDL